MLRGGRWREGSNEREKRKKWRERKRGWQGERGGGEVMKGRGERREEEKKINRFDKEVKR